MKFKFTADIEFEADDLEGAFYKLATHFLDVSDSKFDFRGTLEIEPAEEEKIPYG